MKCNFLFELESTFDVSRLLPINFEFSFQLMDREQTVGLSLGEIR